MVKKLRRQMTEKSKIMSKNDIQVDWCFVIEKAFLHLNNVWMETMLFKKDTINDMNGHPNCCWSALFKTSRSLLFYVHMQRWKTEKKNSHKNGVILHRPDNPDNSTVNSLYYHDTFLWYLCFKFISAPLGHTSSQDSKTSTFLLSKNHGHYSISRFNMHDLWYVHRWLHRFRW